MTVKRKPTVVVIGAGMTGILAVIKLRKAGITNITVLEKKDKIGGTWRENTYPGVACDVASHLYSYQFEPNANWSEFFSSGAEIQQYFEKVAEKYDVYSAIRFQQTVTDTHYENGQWLIKTNNNDQYQADFLIAATGILHHPSFPEIAGINDFKGNMFHTAQWDHSVKIDSTQNVGVIGTGSTAAQAIPELINSGAKVSVFQRTPQWILPLSNFKFPEFSKKLAKRFPCYQKFLRKIPQFILEHFFTKAVTGHPIQKWLLSSLCRLNLTLSIKNKALRKALTPNYQVGCKRVIVNTTFYKAIQKANAELITDDIDHIVAEGIITKSGQLIALDTLILSTGFDPLAFMRPMNMTGKDGVSIEQAWQENFNCYRSILLKDFPNFFLMLGPYTPIGNFSVIAISEVQLDYIIQLMDAWQADKFDAIEPQQAAIERFEQHVKKGLKNTTWVAGCNSWYLDKQGDPILWPYTWKQWQAEMSAPNFNDLQLHKLS